MKKVKIPIFLVVVFSFLFIFFEFKTSTIDAAFDCLKLTSSSNQVDKDYCRGELSKIEAELARLLELQKEQQKQTGTLKGDVDFLTSQINALKAKIKARSLVIAQLKVSIKEKITKIESLSEKIAREHKSLAKLLRNTNEFDNENMVHLILSDASISDFYNDIDAYASLKKAVKESADVARGIKTETEVVKKDLEKKQDSETDAKAELENAQAKVAQSESEKRELLSISKFKENAYQSLAADKKAKADKIRAALFSLAGVSKGIPFGTALTYANEARQKTGIDPAFLLAVLTQESNLGANVGQCYLANTETGSGVGKNTGRVFTNVMKPTRDVASFLEITGKLNLNQYQTPVSCPIAGVAGYGGAMGPAQFIPSTWQLFIGRLEAILGHYPNPWEPEDAFMASSMYLTDLGAIGSSASAQHRAACKYYGSGGNFCTYSTSVMKLKAGIQANIDVLQSS